VPLDPFHRGLDEFGGLDLFLLHELGKPEAVIVRIFSKTHARLPRVEKTAKGRHYITLCCFEIGANPLLKPTRLLSRRPSIPTVPLESVLWPKADMREGGSDVCFRGQSGHS
jgi:hypothetical protein